MLAALFDLFFIQPIQIGQSSNRLKRRRDFSKNKSDPPKNITKENNGLTKPPVILTKAREADATNPIPKLKLKSRDTRVDVS